VIIEKKQCTSCKRFKNIQQEFHRAGKGYRSRCKLCRLYYEKKRISEKLGLPFNLTVDYLHSLWTGICPITNSPIYLSTEGGPKAHLDRFYPELGYVQGNVSFINSRMNVLKSNGTTQEFLMILKWMMSKEGATTIPLWE